MKSAAVKERDEAAEQIAKLAAELECADDKGKLNNRFVDSFQKYAAIEELTKEIVEDVLKEIRIYPGGRFEIVWNYQEEFEKILLALE